MNKDVIYIEPEDDITDIISKLRASRQKVVALVPPKKIGVLRSAVNTKLIAKAAKSAEKVVVVVTTDSSLVKLAASAGIPIAKNLQSRPKLPSEIAEEDEKAPEIIEDKPEEKPADKPSERPASRKTTELSSDDIEDEPEKKPERKSAEKGKKSKKSAKKDKEEEDKENLTPLQRYKKLIIAGSVGVVALIVFLVWAIVFAPAATIAVQIRTTSNNFSEAVSFTTNSGSADVPKGKFLLETQTYKQENAVTFQATGTKDLGEKASGTLQVGVYILEIGESAAVSNGTTFTYNGLSYTVTDGASVTWTEVDSTSEQIAMCENSSELNRNNINNPARRDETYKGCLMTVVVTVTANEGGEKYNIDPHSTGWTSSVSTGKIANVNKFTGGTSKIVTVVQESDITSAKAALAAKVTGDGKSRLLSSISSDLMVIESTYNEVSEDPVSTPKVGEEVASGVTPKLSSSTTYTVLTLDTSDLKRYIEETTTAKLADDQKIYETTDPFLERFNDDGNGNYTARLKATTKVGPKVTEEEILEKAKGRKVGEIQSLLKSINGVSSCKVETSFFWVNSVPNDANKITVSLEVEK